MQLIKHVLLELLLCLELISGCELDLATTGRT